MNPNQTDSPATPGARVAVVGAGIAGLRCALALREAGFDVRVFERSGRVGGRMGTDRVDGFLLDRGFHVMQTAYPSARRAFDFEALEARALEPGAIVVDSRRGSPAMRLLADPFRRPTQAIRSAFSGFAPWSDLVRTGRMRIETGRGPLHRVFSGGDGSTRARLEELGFGEDMIERFFLPLFGGIFLEADLRTSERMLRFVFRMMSEGDMVLPVDGIQGAPEALADRIGRSHIQLSSDVQILGPRELRIGDETQTFDQVVRAHPENRSGPERHVWTVHLDAPSSPLPSRHLLLNGDLSRPDQVVAHVAVPSDVQPSYAPAGRSLVTATVIRRDSAHAAGLVDQTAIEGAVRRDLSRWFGEEVEGWRALAVQHVRWALPEVAAGDGVGAGPRATGPIIECGDQTLHGSLEGALLSAEVAAEHARIRIASAQEVISR